MTIGLVLYPLGEAKATGLGRMAHSLAEALMTEYPEHQYHLYTKGPVEEGLLFPTATYELHVGQGIAWLDRLLLRTPKCDVYYFSTPMLPLIVTPRRSVAVVHDFAYLSPYVPVPFFRRQVLRLIQWWSLFRVSRVIAISAYTKKETIRLLSIPAQKIQVIYNGVNPVLSVPPEPVEGVRAPYFLYAGGMKSRKNVRNVIRAFTVFVQENPNTDTSLVLCGGVRAAYTQSVISLADELGIVQRVHFVGFVTPGQLSYLYANALAFVFPSRVEGFGMAALEAMAIGLPTIASSTGALAEAVGEGALTVDPEQPEDIAVAMGRIVSDSILRAELNERGRARAALFSWSTAARETEHLLRSLLS